MKAKSGRRVFLVGRDLLGRTPISKPFVGLTDADSIRKALRDGSSDSSWIAGDEASLDQLIRTAVATGRPRHCVGRLAVLKRPRPESLAPAQSLFDLVLANGKWLPDQELLDALGATRRQDLIIGGLVDPGTETVTLYRGDLRPLAVPFSLFPVSATGASPDFRRFKPIDYGHAVRFGAYESAVDAILYNADPDFRRREKAKRRDADQGLGPALRRLRLQRGLRPSDFGPVSERTIHRIESGRIRSPRVGTLEAIAARLGVEAGEIETF